MMVVGAERHAAEPELISREASTKIVVNSQHHRNKYREPRFPLQRAAIAP
jgi:hypothetical protein